MLMALKDVIAVSMERRETSAEKPEESLVGELEVMSTKVASEQGAGSDQENQFEAFKDFFAAGLRMPPHPVLVDILCKFRVQLHQLTPNAIVQISKFIWAVTSCGGCPTADVFAHHYELHYQNKKVHLAGSDTTFTAQFGCISFHSSHFGNRARLTLATSNKWTSSWDGN
jgi:hypothetical protein